MDLDDGDYDGHGDGLASLSVRRCGMIRVHLYSNGEQVLLNMDLAQYVQPTTHRDANGQANAIIAFDEEAKFYVSETVEEIEAMCMGPKVTIDETRIGEIIHRNIEWAVGSRATGLDPSFSAPYDMDAKVDGLVKDVFDDLTDRKGVFEDIDDEVMDEIKAEIKKIVVDSGAFGGAR